MDRTEPRGVPTENLQRSPATDDGEEEVVAEETPAAAVAPHAGVRRAPASSGGGSSQPTCQAERCTANLGEAKRYHRRHKVCEAHSKAATVIVAGIQQRFCQQCSRFHEISEFDDTKRSCRRRLAGHNERRRKNSSSSSEPQGECSSRCRHSDEGGRLELSLPENPTYKHFHIR